MLVIGFNFQTPVFEGLHIISQDKMMAFRKTQLQVIIIVGTIRIGRLSKIDIQRLGLRMQSIAKAEAVLVIQLVL
jgi:hypothetical protein